MKRGFVKKIVTGALAASFILAAGGCSPKLDYDPDYEAYDPDLRVEDTRNLTPQQYSVFNTTATDDFGRSFYSVDNVVDGERQVGMFFFLSLGQHTNHTGIYDVTKITDNGKNLDAFFVDSPESPNNSAHFWGEPVWGYYDSRDPWVIRKQIEMLTMAGIDFLILDASNFVTYKAVTDVLFPIMQEYYDAGWDVPKFCYYTGALAADGSDSKTEIKELYDRIYSKGLYKDIWFCPYTEGKPFMIKSEFNKYEPGDPIGDFFDFRPRQWPINDVFKPDGIPWIEFSFPQPVHTDWMSVSVAQHAKTVKFSDINGTAGRGATWEYDDLLGDYDFTNNHDENVWAAGANYEQQWSTVLKHKDEVRFTFITGWNEWVAQKQSDPGGTYLMCDQFNAEYSRDIEPSRSASLRDNFYLQTIRNIRANNYSEAKHYQYPSLTMDISKDDEQWDKVNTYMDFSGESVKRDFKKFAGLQKYVDTSNRNDIETIKVARDSENMYFRVTTKENITTYNSGDTSWMNIWIRTANGVGKMLNGYNYVINRNVSAEGKTDILRCKGADDFTKVGEGDVKVIGKTMIVRIPLSVIHLSEDNYNIQFKVTDNVKNIETDILNLYSTGDSAPIGRLNYTYGY